MNTERDAFIKEKLDEGLSLSDVQKLLASELDIKMTYLDLRLLAADLEINWAKRDEAKAEEAKSDDDMDISKIPEPEDDDGTPKTRIEISKLARPGMAISGDVVFLSGAKGEWFLDNQGRLGFNPTEGSAQPTEDDLRDFQQELQQKLSSGAM
ncbi:MAG: hypothetical protein HN849_06880 [Victivallales bacterium]|jgi:hypothetical protein|nr:hypothetical protein [Victivallales bacterium]MBT7162077.1 hypothetical protein [Victivallales bacterium]MBT7299216.1 hypothetical protein [Victivallales bacterium]